MISETIYAHSPDGNCQSINISLAEPEPHEGDWSILVTIKSSDGTLNFQDKLYQVTPLCCLKTALSFISTLLQGTKEHKGWTLSTSPEQDDDSVLNWENYPMFAQKG